MKEKIDFIFNKLIPKKFLAWAIATILIFMRILPAEYWFYITLAYLGTNVIAKFVKPKDL